MIGFCFVVVVVVCFVLFFVCLFVFVLFCFVFCFVFRTTSAGSFNTIFALLFSYKYEILNIKANLQLVYCIDSEPFDDLFFPRQS